MAKQRVVEEKKALNDKMLKLEEFMKTPKFKDLDIINTSLLETQLKTMYAYSHILYMRLEMWKD